ncbi:MAG: quinone oxidoreductase family protein [Nocardioidaceae bacterium]
MRAAVIEAHGRPPALVDRAEPAPGPGQVLVRVTAAPITPLDVLCATGTSYFGAQPVPYVPGVQGVGVVARSGTSERVWFPTTAGMRPGDGSMAEYAVAEEVDLVTLGQAEVADATVAALGLSAVAAWMALTWRAGLREGEQVLVLGAGGVVGQVAVQAAKLLGARRVVAACRSRLAQERAAACGADAVVELRDADTPAELSERLAKALEEPLDVVVDPLFGVPATAALGLLGSRGRLVNLGSSAGETAVVQSAHLRSHTASVLGYTNNDITREQRAAALGDIMRHAAAGDLEVSHEVVRFDDAPSAWRRLADGAAPSRPVLDLT